MLIDETFKWHKATKNKHVFTSTDFDNSHIQTIYIDKKAFNGQSPEKQKLRITVDFTDVSQ